MRKAAGIFVITAMIVWLSTPALACLLTPQKLTESEMQCCREMAGQCGEMAKAEHSCCPKSPAKVQHEKATVLATAEKQAVVAPALVVVHTGVAVPASAMISPRSSPAFQAESPPGALTPLRI